MRTTIDQAGRLVVPKALRERIGMVAGEVEIEVDGAGLHLEPVAGGRLERKGDILVVVGQSEAEVDDEAVRALRMADQR